MANTAGVHVTDRASCIDRAVWKSNVTSARENMCFDHVEAEKVEWT